MYIYIDSEYKSIYTVVIHIVYLYILIYKITIYCSQVKAGGIV